MEQLLHYTFQYYGVDWMVTLTVFAGIFLLGDKEKLGFIVGMISAAFGIIFSIQIGSIANGLASVVLLVLYLRGYLKWKSEPTNIEKLSKVDSLKNEHYAEVPQRSQPKS